MYLIKCITDNSLCIVKNENIFCDLHTVKEGDEVKFQYGNMHYEGIIIMISDDILMLENKRKKLKKSGVNESQNKSDENILPEKRQRRPKKFSSFETFPEIKKNSNRKEKRKPVVNSQTTLNTTTTNKINKVIKKNQQVLARTENTSDSYSSDESSSKPSKKQKYIQRKKDIQVLKEIQNKTSMKSGTSSSSTKLTPVASISTQETILSSTDEFSDNEESDINYDNEENAINSDNYGNTKNSINNDKETDLNDVINDEESNVSDYDDEEIDVGQQVKTLLKSPISLSHQLFGENWENDMKLLDKRLKIYCKPWIFHTTLVSAKSVTGIARRLMDGVFNHEQIQNCTLTGQAPRAQGLERMQQKYDCLDPAAVTAIIDFAKKVGKKLQWTIPNDQRIKTSMSNKLRTIQKQTKK